MKIRHEMTASEITTALNELYAERDKVNAVIDGEQSDPLELLPILAEIEDQIKFAREILECKR